MALSAYDHPVIAQASGHHQGFVAHFARVGVHRHVHGVDGTFAAVTSGKNDAAKSSCIEFLGQKEGQGAFSRAASGEISNGNDRQSQTLGTLGMAIKLAIAGFDQLAVKGGQGSENVADQAHAFSIAHLERDLFLQNL